jgi:hypothetical protein
MCFIFSTPVLIRHLRLLETTVFLHRCLIHVVMLSPALTIVWKYKTELLSLYFYPPSRCPPFFPSISPSVSLSLSCEIFSFPLSVYLPLSLSLYFSPFFTHTHTQLFFLSLTLYVFLLHLHLHTHTNTFSSLSLSLLFSLPFTS